MEHQEFFKRLDFVKRHVLNTYELFEAYIYVYNKQSIDADAMNYIPGFFQLVLYSFLNQFAITLSCLYDDDDNSISLKKLRNCFEQLRLDKGADSKTKRRVLDEIDKRLNAQFENIKKIKILRDKALAHNDKQGMQIDIWTEKAQISIGEYRDLIETAYNIVCACLDFLQYPIPKRTIGIENDVDLLLDAIKMSMEFV